MRMKTSYVFMADGFEEVEALTVVDVLRRAGMPVVTVSVNATSEVTGAHGVKMLADTVIAGCDLADAQWLILPGGMPGASNLAACEPLTRQLLEQDKAGRGIAAICASPSIVFGPLGLVEGREAVCYPGMEQGLKGAQVMQSRVAVDGHVVTGNGPASATAFALAIVEQTLGKPAATEVADGMLV